MDANTNTAELDLPAPPEPGLTADQVIARAEAMVPELVERQAETEERTFYAEDIHDRFLRNGFYRILVPRRYGGYELGIDTFLRVSMTLLRGCPSTGWMYTLGAAHALVTATIFGERAQAEMFADGDFICPSTSIPSGTATPAADGGWTVSGTWSYCSGSPYANHFMGHALLPAEDGQPPVPLLFVAPRSQWVRLDDWGQQLGLRGSGSHSIRIENAHIPAHMALPGVQLVEYDATSGTPGRTLHGNPEYGGAQLAFINFLSCSTAIGMVRGALDAYEDLLRVRTTLVPPVVPRYLDPDYQLWYGDLVGLIGTAEAALLNAAQQWQDAAAQGPAAVTRELDLRLSAISRHVCQLCWEAMEGHIVPTAGSSAIRRGERLERVWRDMSTLRTHAGLSILLPTIAMRELAKSLVH
ncbi:3-hydroxy-9,10-secoandrosta-1,3,5(10)-triene-9,17-dione monooxygenase [Micromonospora sp. M71_S20]|uniref:acyl-CoA dehydrogenase family protein n=1 Tax=Micromonospora sp. M71_S20 TaxID=592872 RepID=UPI000EB52A19|nr:acyl-CoA dehydrogenase family protein [Micromonospora sp. M71_S20]RLK09654.1 3-hydroxy-9,10-secoandrosta-1,3,5(10)-triene-9,17-dione monooxygenase [Micromonospora sp. M71_S20]